MTRRDEGTDVTALTWDFHDGEQLVRKQLDRRILTLQGGMWATILYLYQDFDRKNLEWRKPRLAIVRYKKMRISLQWHKHSHFPINSTQAAQCIDIFCEWLGVDGVPNQAELIASQAAAEQEQEPDWESQPPAFAPPPEDEEASPAIPYTHPRSVVAKL